MTYSETCDKIMQALQAGAAQIGMPQDKIQEDAVEILPPGINVIIEPISKRNTEASSSGATLYSVSLIISVDGVLSKSRRVAMEYAEKVESVIAKAEIPRLKYEGKQIAETNVDRTFVAVLYGI